jgi:uncharacterized tellurite resistance protein B-like protein
MEQSTPDRYLLYDLALIYLALAHGTDARLDDAEVDAMAARLHAWQATASGETVLRAVRDALGVYTRGAAQAEVARAVQDVADTVAPVERQRIVNDLVHIALADGQFLHEEGAFIGSLARVWDVHLPQQSDGAGWSLLWSEPRTWTPVHDLTFVYLTLAHKTDCELSRAEIQAVIKKVGEWLPEAGEDDVEALVQTVLASYARQGGARALAEAVASVKAAVPSHQRAALLSDLHYVANADGVMLVEEKQMIAQLAQAWGIPLNI